VSAIDAQALIWEATRLLTMEVNGSKPMIDTVLNLLFNFPHRHLTRPFTPVNHAGTYVVCLDCAKQFAYDFERMHIGKPIDRSHGACVLQVKVPHPNRPKLKYALAGAGVPLAILLGSKLASILSNRKNKS
jgi:hypothetical protein